MADLIAWPGTTAVRVCVILTMVPGATGRVILSSCWRYSGAENTRMPAKVAKRPRSAPRRKLRPAADTAEDTKLTSPST